MGSLKCRVLYSDEERAEGLQHASSLPYNEGVWFQFARPSTTGFWMKNTKIPLDICFLDKVGKVIEVQQMYPYSEQIHRCSRPYSCAIETNLGWFEDNGIQPGDNIYDKVELDTL